MKKRLLIILAIIASFALIATGVILSFPKTQKEKPTQDDYSIKTINSVKVCTNPECEPPMEDYYANMIHKYDSKVLQDAIKKINKTTDDYYKEVIATDMSDANCESLRANNQYSLRILSRYNSYTTDKVITLSVQRTKINICTYEATHMLSETYVYDIENDKLLTVAETKKLLGITEEQIYNAIRASNTKLAKMENVEIETPGKFPDDQIAIFYGTDGYLYVEYFVQELNSYNQAEIGQVEK